MSTFKLISALTPLSFRVRKCVAQILGQGAVDFINVLGSARC